MNDTNQLLKRINFLEMEIKKYRDWIEKEAEISDICTRDILGDVCKDCFCGKKK